MPPCFRSRALCCAVWALGLTSALPNMAAAASQCEQEKPLSLALLKWSGLYGAMEKACHNKSDADLAHRKQKSIASLKKETCMSSAEMGAAYDAGYQEAEAVMQKASASERASECKAFDARK